MQEQFGTQLGADEMAKAEQLVKLANCTLITGGLLGWLTKESTAANKAEIRKVCQLTLKKASKPEVAVYHDLDKVLVDRAVAAITNRG